MVELAADGTTGVRTEAEGTTLIHADADGITGVQAEVDGANGSQTQANRRTTLQAISTARLQQRLRRSDEDIMVIERQFHQMDRSLLKLHRRWEKKKEEVDTLRRNVYEKKTALNRIQQETLHCLDAVYHRHEMPWRKTAEPVDPANSGGDDSADSFDEDLSKLDEYLESMKRINAELVQDEDSLARVDVHPSNVCKHPVKKSHKRAI